MTQHALLVDLYELTMAASYLAEGMNFPATFDLSFRELPPGRNFLISCGLDQALDYLESLRFEEEDLAYLEGLSMFGDEFLDYLALLTFTGEVWAIPEGDAVFPPEPVLRVTAPLIEAQIVETYLLNCMNFSTLIASKAARVHLACQARSFVDFSARRDHGPDAAVYAARAAFIGGAAGTSNLLAGKLFGIPVSGTMAHAYVMAFDSEIESFRAFGRTFGERTILLIDTFDTIEGARRAAKVAGEMAEKGVEITGVRLDSGDLAELSRSVRKILDSSGLEKMQIFASGDLDEYRIAELLSSGAPIDAFGVGTQLGVSGDAPALGGIYKLVEDPAGPKLKLSTGKMTLPGLKQVYRVERGGEYQGDLIALADEPAPEGARPVLERVMAGGRRTSIPPSLTEMKDRCMRTLASLPSYLKSLDPSAPYPVDLSQGLEDLRSGAVQGRDGGKR